MNKISDEEREELLFLRALVNQLQLENDDLKNLLQQNNIEYEGKDSKSQKMKKEEFNSKDLEVKIKKLSIEIEAHRLEKEGQCWIFGIKNNNFDYGSIWSDPSYWKLLQESNNVDKNFCLFNFGFQKQKLVCKNCDEKVDILEGFYKLYLKNLRKIYNIV